MSFITRLFNSNTSTGADLWMLYRIKEVAEDAYTEMLECYGHNWEYRLFQVWDGDEDDDVFYTWKHTSTNVAQQAMRRAAGAMRYNEHIPRGIMRTHLLWRVTYLWFELMRERYSCNYEFLGALENQERRIVRNIVDGRIHRYHDPVATWYALG